MTTTVEIPLYNAADEVVAYATVDADDVALVAEHCWYFSKDGYARSRRHANVLMHRLILGLTKGDKLQSDHIDRDKLNNRRSNLRIVTAAQNAQNLGPRKRSKTGVRGVYFNREIKARPWAASCTLNQVVHPLGYYATLAEAEAVVTAFRAQHMPFSADAMQTTNV